MFGIETMFRLIFFAAKKGPCNNSLKTHLHPAASQIDSFYCVMFAHVSLSFELSQSKIASARFSILMQNVAKVRNYKTPGRCCVLFLFTADIQDSRYLENYLRLVLDMCTVLDFYFLHTLCINKMVENRGQAKGYYIIAKVRQFSTTGWRDKSSNVKVVQIIVQKWLEKGWILLTSVGVSEYNGIAILPAGITKHRTFVARVTDNKIGTWEHKRSFN